MNIPYVTLNSKKMGLAGILPGYNPNIDTSNEFERDLLNNISFIDLIPATYSINWISDIINAGLSVITKNKVNKKHGKGRLYSYSVEDTTAGATFKQTTKRYLGEELDGMRLISSNDTVFTENLSNQFNDNNIIDSIESMSGGILNKLGTKQNGQLNFIGATTKAFQSTAAGIGKATAGIIKMDYDTAFKIMGNHMVGASELDSLITRKALGLKLSTPQVFSDSSYQDSISVFIKLTTPTGHPDDIEKYILKPLQGLILLAAPLSYDGLTYGVPFIWNIKSYGNTEFNVGVVSTLTITRGSMETMYNKYLMPMQVDVRITLTSLADKFAQIAPRLNLSGKPVNYISDLKNIEDEYNLVGLVTPGLENKINKRTDNKIITRPETITVTL